MTIMHDGKIRLDTRDRIAIEAMKPLIRISPDVDDFGPEEIAREAYLYASAMLEEGQK